MIEFYLNTKFFVNINKHTAIILIIKFCGQKGHVEDCQEVSNFRIVPNLNKKRSGRSRKIRTRENIGAVRCSVVSKSKKVLSATISRVGHLSNKVSPYYEIGFKTFTEYFLDQAQLTAKDEQTQFDICNWFTDKIENNEDGIDDVWSGDETHSDTGDYINLKNNNYDGTASPQEVLQRPLHSSNDTASRL